jgi:ketosteroid isomerase-like protein
VDETEATARAWVDACNGDDMDAVLGLLDPDVELHEASTLPGAVAAVGRDEVVHYLERFDTHWSSFHWQPLEWRFHGDQALLHARLHLRGQKSGIEVHREWVYVFTIRDGKLLRQDGFDDMAGAEARFGAGA